MALGFVSVSQTVGEVYKTLQDAHVSVKSIPLVGVKVKGIVLCYNNSNPN